MHGLIFLLNRVICIAEESIGLTRKWKCHTEEILIDRKLEVQSVDWL
jgi:hypothetical protein